jgi:hypothetical protein
VYKNTAALRATRSKMYEECERAGKEFHGVIVSHPLKRLVIDPYQLLFHATIQQNFYRHLVPKATLHAIRAANFESGIFASLEATRLYQLLHYERVGSIGHPTVLIPDVVARNIIAACTHRAQTCGLGDRAALTAGLTSEQLTQRISLAIRLPAGVILNEEVVEMVIKAAAFSAIRPLIQSNPSLKLFFEALVSCDAATPAQRLRVRQLFERTPSLEYLSRGTTATVVASVTHEAHEPSSLSSPPRVADEDVEYQSGQDNAATPTP